MERKIVVSDLKDWEIVKASKLLGAIIGASSKHYTLQEIKKIQEEYSPTNIRLLLARGGTIFRTAKINGKIVGLAIANLYPFRNMIDVCWINWVVVKKAYRRAGVGSTLLKSFEKEPKRRWQVIRGHVRVSNKISNNMFNKLGYKKLKTLYRSVQKNNAYRYEKKL